MVTALCPGLIRTEFQTVSNTENYQAEFPDFVWLDLPEVVTQRAGGGGQGPGAVVPGALYKSASWAARHHAALAQAGGQRHGPAALTTARGRPLRGQWSERYE